MKFNVKRDFLWIFIINLVLVLLMVLPFTGLGLGTVAVVFFFALFGFVLALLILFDSGAIHTECVVKEGVLVYRTGAFKKVIFFDEVVRVEKVRNLKSFMSFSIDKIEVVTEEYGKRRYYYISVKESDELLALIEKSMPKATKKVEEKKVEKPVEVAPKAPAKKTTAKKENK